MGTGWQSVDLDQLFGVVFWRVVVVPLHARGWRTAHSVARIVLSFAGVFIDWFILGSLVGIASRAAATGSLAAIPS